VLRVFRRTVGDQAVNRERLPNRRPNETAELEFDGVRYAATLGYFPGAGAISRRNGPDPACATATRVGGPGRHQ